MGNFPILLSESILLHAETSKDSSSLRRELYFIKTEKLESYLDTDELKSVFWINIYNAYAIIISKETTETETVFKSKRIKVGHNAFSLDDIEFKILRLNNRNLLRRFLDRSFCSFYIRKLALEKADYSLKTMLDRTPLISG